MNEVNSMIFYRGFYEAIRWLDDADQLICYQTIMAYALDGIEPDTKGPVRAVFESCRAQIDVNNKRRANGLKGGRPRGNQEETKTEPNRNQTETKVKPKENQEETKTEPTETKPKPNVNVNVNDNVNYNNNNINNINNNTLFNNTHCPASQDDVRQIIDHLNAKAHKNFRYDTKSTKTLIKARLNEGYTIDDFKKVIDNKCAEWLRTDQEQYLRPETLFAPSHFESYLNQKRIKRKSKNDFLNFEQHDYDMDELTKRLFSDDDDDKKTWPREEYDIKELTRRAKA